MDSFIENIQLPDGTTVKIKGVPSGGATGQILSKASNADSDTVWIDNQDLSSFATKEDLQSGLDSKQDLGAYALQENTYTKEETEQLIADSVTSGTLDLSNYCTISTANEIKALAESKQDAGDYALKSELPKNVSELVNDANYLTEHQDVSNKADKATTLAGYGIEDAYTKSEVDSKISSVYRYKGTVANVDALPSEGNEVGDTYNIEDNGSNYAWTGTAWDKLSETLDLSIYATKQDLSSKQDAGDYALRSEIYSKEEAYSKTEIDSMLGDINTILDDILGA